MPTLFRYFLHSSTFTFRYFYTLSLASEAPGFPDASDFLLPWPLMKHVSPSVLESCDWYLQPHVHWSQEGTNLGQSGGINLLFNAAKSGRAHKDQAHPCAQAFDSHSQKVLFRENSSEVEQEGRGQLGTVILQGLFLFQRQRQ